MDDLGDKGMKLGLEWDYRSCEDIETQARRIKDHGFDATFLDLEIDRIDKIMNELAKNGIECESYHAPFRGVNDMWIAGEAGEIMLQRICQCVDDCKHYDVPVAVVHLSSGRTPPRMNDVGFERYDRLMEHADKKGVILAYENVRRLDFLSYALENYPKAGFCWDVGHEACYYNGIELMPLFGKRIVSLHLHDNMAVYDGDEHMFPYDGVIDMDKAAKHLALSPYSGSVMLEVTPDSSGTKSTEEFYQKAYDVASRFARTVENYRKV